MECLCEQHLEHRDKTFSKWNLFIYIETAVSLQLLFLSHKKTQLANWMSMWMIFSLEDMNGSLENEQKLRR